MSLVPSFKKTKMTHRNLLRRWNSFCQPPYHVSNPPQFPFYANLPGLHSRTSEIGIFPSVQNPSRRHHKFCNEFKHPIMPFKILILNSRLVHDSLLPRVAYSLAHVILWRKYFVTSNTFRTVRATLDIFLIFVTNKKKACMEATLNIRKKHMILCWCDCCNKG
jgi:hypothetical protein